jgi:serine/threonine protein kinase
MEHHGSPWAAPEKRKKNPSKNSSPYSLPALAAAAKETGPKYADQLCVEPAEISPSSSPSSSLVAPPPMVRRLSCDLFECIEQHSRLPEDKARHVLGQVANIIHALDRQGICHRDIKDENIVVDQDFNVRFPPPSPLGTCDDETLIKSLRIQVKLIDFGSAVLFDPYEAPVFYNRFYGTLNFARYDCQCLRVGINNAHAKTCSAEILQGKPYRARPAEVWSLGVLLCVLVTGECPFVDHDHAKEGRMSTPKVALSRECLDLMRLCLEPNPDKRITISDVRHHPFLVGRPVVPGHRGYRR